MANALKSYFYAQPNKHTAVLISSAPPTPPNEKIQRPPWSWRHRSTWGKKTYGALSLIIAAIIAVAVVPAVLARSHVNPQYPNYLPIKYALKETWSGESFFGNFDFYTKPDPTLGFVTYVNQTFADTHNLTYANATSATMRVDTSANATAGRNSVRIVSKNAYNYGLFIFDVAHVPYGCGTWPAIWMTSIDNWPNQGEIDIMETVNQAPYNQYTLHTSANCNVGGQRNQTGTTLTTNCDVGSDSSGSCAVQGSSTSAGPGFNSVGGGVYAMEWRNEGIRMWFFERANIPANIVNSSAPDPSQWPKAAADFPNTYCDIGAHFKDLHVISNIDLCGAWAGAEAVYNEQDQCPSYCIDYVAHNATAFEKAYFTFNSFKIYAAS